MPRLRRSCPPTTTERGSVTPLTLWWLVTAALGAVWMVVATRTVAERLCAQSTADAVVLAHAAHGAHTGARFARSLRAEVTVVGDDPITLLVSSACGAAVASAVHGRG